MTDGYLNLLDALLADGVERLGKGFRAAQHRYILAQQRPDGGFGGRQGGSDPYYTDFALRTLWLTALDRTDPVAAVAPVVSAYLESERPTNVIECFSLLNCARYLRRSGAGISVDHALIDEVMTAQAVADGGFSAPEGSGISAYHTFIAALCYELLGEPFPRSDLVASRIARLQKSSGGFSGQEGAGVEQTSTTAAALGFLVISRALTGEASDAACAYIARMQAPEGGILAHAHAPMPDLLSTFTGLVTLTMLDGHALLDLAALARFVRSCAIPGGGFLACRGDDFPDVEYTFYGVGCVALLRAVLAAEA